ncbi:hypothetical protein [Paracidobacterium acidisoli]|uniref:Uncharacterized protein n=1 Tax=Paracidobacterium acidisoli TaxID=2303751 RepID=A0A372IS31_9BACT|nr:hypothetical protein [Paracidobacterium acidisoli]MBT9330466.1 hypothetical protein [Paracidobacterium acidisoli]
MRQKQNIALISWNTEAIGEQKQRLERAGFTLELSIHRSSGLIGKLARAGVDAVVIDLSSKPSYGREIGIQLRGSPTTRPVPLVFAGGVEEKIALVRVEIPDAVYCSWEQIAAGVKHAIDHAPVRPVQPRTRGAGAVAGSVLARKMGLGGEVRTVILGDVIGLGRRLGIAYEEQIDAQTEIALAVVRTAREMEDVFGMLEAQLPAKAVLWVIHPKQSGKLRSDFTQTDVLATGLAHGFSGFKMCAVDADWSGARLVRKARR